MTTIEIPLPWTAPPLSLNDREHHHAKAVKMSRAISEARAAIRAAKPRWVIAANITLHFRAPDRRRRDADNLAGTLKAVQDALVAEGVLPEDSWITVPRSACQIHAPEPGTPGALWVSLDVITEYDEEIES